jgi:hypothetical protein
VVLSTNAPSATSTSATAAASGEASLDFEIEPDVYRAVEAMVQSLAAGKPLLVPASYCIWVWRIADIGLCRFMALWRFDR